VDSTILAIDLGGSKLAFCVSHNGDVVYEGLQATNKDFSSQLRSIYEEVIYRFGKVAVVAIGVPGPVVGDTMGPSAPLKLSYPHSFSDCFPDVEELIVKNDLHMALLAEIREGHGLTFQNFVLVSISTGIGVAVAIDRLPLEIRTEMGHQKLGLTAAFNRPCINHSGCWASMCSGRALEESGDTTDISVIQEINVHAFANLAAAYDPSAIVVMGGVGLNRFNDLIPSTEAVSHHVLNHPGPKILCSELGDRIGVKGAMQAAKTCLNGKGLYFT
jgi:predicted NBD/HSP70 family sugar kinase